MDNDGNMGLYDQFKERRDAQGFEYVAASDAEAWVAILYACMAADGDVSDVEIDKLSRMLVMKEKFAGLHIGIFFEKVAEAQAMIGSITLVEAAAVKVEVQDRPTLFSMAVDMVLADGILDEDERLMISFIGDSLQIPNGQAQQIIEVILIRNMGNKVIA